MDYRTYIIKSGYVGTMLGLALVGEIGGAVGGVVAGAGGAMLGFLASPVFWVFADESSNHTILEHIFGPACIGGSLMHTAGTAVGEMGGMLAGGLAGGLAGMGTGAVTYPGYKLYQYINRPNTHEAQHPMESMQPEGMKMC